MRVNGCQAIIRMETPNVTCTIKKRIKGVGYGLQKKPNSKDATRKRAI